MPNYINSLVAVFLLFSSTVFALESAQARCQDYTSLRRAYFGDTHVHTAYSQDASTQATRGTPADAYRFAKGERVGIQPYDNSGKALRSQQLAVPLDFTAVTDHSEQLGEVRICNDPNADGHNNWVCLVYRHFPRAAFYMMNIRASQMGSRWGMCGEDGEHCLDVAADVWRDTQAAANAANDACQFTAFNAYEWTGVYGRANNMHRNVIFKSEAVPALPISFIETKTPLSLLRTLDDQCKATGADCDALVIPHNSNLSDGDMFSVNGDDGQPLNADDAALRHRYERLVEIMQHKGSSECYNGSYGQITADELCDFEMLSTVNFNSFDSDQRPPAPETGFVREALRDGLRVGKRTGVNPFKFGIVASTDTHLALPGAAEEDRFQGGGGAGKPARDKIPEGFPDKLEYNPGGLAVLYAEENTREALFAAMQRREAYGTSGPRLNIRFFAGHDLPDDLCESPDMLAQAYARGVPMGGDLAAVAGDSKPRFLVSAARDSLSQPLQRLQVIKGWVDANGESREQVVEVAGNPSNGASVDTQSCQSSGTGYGNLCRVWRDDDFDPQQDAYYYMRAVENPSCRWSQRVCNANNVDCKDSASIPDGLEGCCSVEHKPTVQERAWSSPIWYKAPSNNVN